MDLLSEQLERRTREFASEPCHVGESAGEVSLEEVAVTRAVKAWLITDEIGIIEQWRVRTHAKNNTS